MTLPSVSRRLGVELDQPVEVGDLEVDEPLAGRQRHRTDCRAHVGVAGLGQLLAHVPALGDLEVGVAHGLEPAVALQGIVDRADLHRARTGRVPRGVDLADARVEDPRTVLGVVVLVRRLTGLEPAQPVPHRDLLAVHGLVDHGVLEHLALGRVADDQPASVGREAHVVGAVAVHLLLADDAVRAALHGLRDVHPHHVGEARPGDREVATVARGEHVVDVLVVALAGTLLDREVERQLLRVGPDVGELLLLVGDQVHAPLEHLEPALVHDRRGAGPVVAHPHHVAERAAGRGRCRGALGRSGRRNGAGEQRHGQREQGKEGCTSHARVNDQARGASRSTAPAGTAARGR